VAAADEGHVVEVRCSSVFPGFEVMRLAPRRRPVALGEHAVLVTLDERGSLRSSSRSYSASLIQHDPVRPEHRRDDVGIACQASDRGGGDGYTVGGCARRTEPKLAARRPIADRGFNRIRASVGGFECARVVVDYISGPTTATRDDDGRRVVVGLADVFGTSVGPGEPQGSVGISLGDRGIGPCALARWCARYGVWSMRATFVPYGVSNAWWRRARPCRFAGSGRPTAGPYEGRSIGRGEPGPSEEAGDTIPDGLRTPAS
jgi:hypothetical protein